MPSLWQDAVGSFHEFVLVSLLVDLRVSESDSNDRRGSVDVATGAQWILDNCERDGLVYGML